MNDDHGLGYQGNNITRWYAGKVMVTGLQFSGARRAESMELSTSPLRPPSHENSFLKKYNAGPLRPIETKLNAASGRSKTDKVRFEKVA